MADSKSSSGFSIPWPTVLGLLTTVAGALLYFTNLQSDRPPASPEQTTPALGYQDVLARLWQDPLRVVEQQLQQDNQEQLYCCKELPHNSRAKSSHSQLGLQPSHTFGELCDQINASANGNVLILGVMVPGGPYAELGEQRLRERVAILEGLDGCGFEPNDSEHIGYIELPWYWTPIHPSKPWTYAELYDRVRQPDPGPAPLVLPYEWCQQSPLPLPSEQRLFPKGTNAKNILVLWLNEDAVGDYPLRRLGAIWNAIKNSNKSRGKPGDGMVTFKLIGPSVSTTLRAMVEEASPEYSSGMPNDILTGVEMYSPTASTDETMLFQHVTMDEAPRPKLTELLSRASGLNLVRTTFTDDWICRSLYDELSLRCGTRNGDLGDVAIVSEWDTFYGKALPICFAAATTRPANGSADPRPLSVRPDQTQYESELLNNSKPFPKWIYPFRYLRGIDGNTPGGDDSAASSNQQSAGADGSKQSQGLKIQGPGEAPEGLNQTDYLRRLADQLVQLDWHLRHSGEAGLTAVGVLGTDLYDKLLILRALRDRLPGLVFFTIDIDARYMLPTEWQAAHNLIIVSSYGLALDPSYQTSVAPFRDCNQTAEFAATLFALGAIPPKAYEGGIDQILHLPRRFEIARTGVFDISPDSGSMSNPPREDYSAQPWSDLESQGLLALSLLALLFTIYFLLGRPTVVLREFKPYIPLLVAVLGMYILLAMCPKVDNYEGEPLSFIGGLSIWPTEAVRVLALGLCYFFVRKARVDATGNDKKMQTLFKLAPLAGNEKTYVDTCHRKADALEMPRARQKLLVDNDWQIFGPPSKEDDPDNWAVAAKENDHGTRVYAQSLWWHYQMRGAWPMRKWRVMLCSCVYILLMFVLAVPILHTKVPIPARGPFAMRLDGLILLASVAGSIVLVFFVLDACYLNRKIIIFLTKPYTHWPYGAFDSFKKGDEIYSDLTEYLGIRFIAKRTQSVGKVIYYPFIVFLLMILSRNSFFDNWSWPIGLILIFALNFVMAIIAALMLRWAAEEARRKAIRRIRKRQRGYAAVGSPQADLMDKLRELVENETEGAFSILAGHPLLAAVLLPGGSIGAWAILQYFAQPTH